MPGADPASQPGGPARSAVTFAGVSAHWWARIGGRAAVLVVALFLAESAAAQQRAAFGAEVGYSRADMIGEASDLVEARQGAITGVYLHLPLNRVLSLRPELLFSLRGGRTLVRVADPPSIADLDIELAYFEVPVLARAALPHGRFRPVVFGGPSLAVQIGCDFVLTGDTSSTRLTCGQPREARRSPRRCWTRSAAGIWPGSPEPRSRCICPAPSSRCRVGTRRAPGPFWKGRWT